MTKWAASVNIICKAADRDAANKMMEQLGWGPNNINVPLKSGQWTTDIPLTAEMLADLQQLADKHPKLDLTITYRDQGSKRAKDRCSAKAKAAFDKAEYQSTAAGRTKAKVAITEAITIEKKAAK